VSIITARPPNGSTAPLRLPIVNERHRLLPSARIGMEIMATSGMFCMAIPIDIASATAELMPASPDAAQASTTPTAMPSGKLCMVTASESIAVRDKRVCGPSGLLVRVCK